MTTIVPGRCVAEARRRPAPREPAPDRAVAPDGRNVPGRDSRGDVAGNHDGAAGRAAGPDGGPEGGRG